MTLSWQTANPHIDEGDSKFLPRSDITAVHTLQAEANHLVSSVSTELRNLEAEPHTAHSPTLPCCLPDEKYKRHQTP